MKADESAADHLEDVSSLRCCARAVDVLEGIGRQIRDLNIVLISIERLGE